MEKGLEMKKLVLSGFLASEEIYINQLEALLLVRHTQRHAHTHAHACAAERNCVLSYTVCVDDAVVKMISLSFKCSDPDGHINLFYEKNSM